MGASATLADDWGVMKATTRHLPHLRDEGAASATSAFAVRKSGLFRKSLAAAMREC
jgi:hypothetical protein